MNDLSLARAATLLAYRGALPFVSTASISEKIRRASRAFRRRSCFHSDGCEIFIEATENECAFHSEVTTRTESLARSRHVPLNPAGCWDGFGLLVRSDHAVRRGSAIERFWKKVDRSGGVDACWRWLASVDTNGFGLFSIHDTLQLAHRVSWMIAHGKIPAGARIRQLCLDKRCVNPAHLPARISSGLSQS